MKITDIKEVTDLFYAINLDKLAIQPINTPDESPWRTYLTCHIYPNFGNFTIYMRLFNGKKEVTSYSRKGWTFLFGDYMHINWNFRSCWYRIIDNTGECKKGTDDPTLGGHFYLEGLSLEMDDLIRLGWRIYADISDEFYSFKHKYLLSNLNANVYSYKKKEVSCSEMGKMVLCRQQFRNEIMDFIDTIPEEKRVVYGESIACMQDLLHHYCNQIWNISINDTE